MGSKVVITLVVSFCNIQESVPTFFFKYCMFLCFILLHIWRFLEFAELVVCMETFPLLLDKALVGSWQGLVVGHLIFCSLLSFTISPAPSLAAPFPGSFSFPSTSHPTFICLSCHLLYIFPFPTFLCSWGPKKIKPFSFLFFIYSSQSFCEIG